MTRKIIIDTDPGQDDAIAICLALSAPDKLNVLGITTVAGNASLARTTDNALKVMALCSRPDIPVHAGAHKPLYGNATTAEHVHGPSGLDGYSLPPTQCAAHSNDAVGFLYDTIMHHPEGDITLCCLGPLTNIAVLFKEHPETIARLRGICLMGGAYFEVGNITPAAEFNFHADPEAADVVFKSGVSLTVMPLDLTHTLLLHHRHKIALEGPSVVQKAISGWVSFFERYDLEKYGSGGAPLHDPSVIAYLIDPSLFTGKAVNVVIECESKLTRGMSVMDWWGVTDRRPNAYVVGTADVDGFFDLLSSHIRRFNDRPVQVDALVT